ncbi:MAG: nicotinamide-nucleotide amidohydrolase family protein [Bdellovibrionota bacterium]
MSFKNMAIAEVLTIGNEILDGRVTDTNRVYLGKKLTELGFEVRHAQSVDDNLERVVQALELAASRSELVVCTGGLGPTGDDLTSEAVAKFLNCPWESNPQAEAFLVKLFVERKRDLSESQLKQAKLPTLCKMISNPVGTAPGFFFQGDYQGKELTLCFFPGIPKEMQPMFEGILKLGVLKEGTSLRKYTWSTLFTSEGALQEKLKKIEQDILPLRIGFRTHLPENHISLMGNVESKEDDQKWIEARSKLNAVLAPLSYHMGTERNYEEMLLENLIKAKARVLFVESCTAGLVSHLLSQVSGASEVLWGSQVCYANEEKFVWGVDPEIIKAHGAVSAECADAMARSGLTRLQQDSSEGLRFRFCVSTTGIAGPTGGTPEKPVGTMYTAIAVENLSTSEVKVTTQKVEAPTFLDRKLFSSTLPRRL